jgi:nucleotide-binding universal stress UspA family protein
MFKHILVTTDGSPLSRLAFPVAADLARTYGSALTLLYVLPLVTTLSGLGDRLAAPFEYREPRLQVQAEAEALLHEAVQQLGVPGVHLVQRGADGLPVARVIAEEVLYGGADLVVMGTQGRSGLAHLLLGSVAEQVLRAVSVPVLLVRSPLAVLNAALDRERVDVDAGAAR